MPNGVFIPNVKGFLPQTALHCKYLEKYCISLLQVPLQQPDSYFTQKLHWIEQSRTHAYKRQSVIKDVSGHSVLSEKVHTCNFFVFALLFSKDLHKYLSFHVRGIYLTLCEKCVIFVHAPSSSPRPFARSHAHAAECMAHIPGTWQHQLNIACQPSSTLGSGFLPERRIPIT